MILSVATKSVAAEDVAGINLLLDIVETGVVAICYDRLRHLFEFLQVVYHKAAEEGGAVVEGGLTSSAIGYVMA